jgi:hypothetical protein
MRRFAKPLYGLTPVPRVRIPPSPPDSRNSIQRRVLRVVAPAHFYINLQTLHEIVLALEAAAPNP